MMARSSSYDPQEPCPQGMWPDEVYLEDTGEYLHRGPQLTSDEWLNCEKGQFIAMPRKPTDLDKTLAEAAGGGPATAKATEKVAPRLQNQGDSGSPSLKRPRDVSATVPVPVAMDVDVVAVDAPLEVEASAVQDGGTTDEEVGCDQPEKKRAADRKW